MRLNCCAGVIFFLMLPGPGLGFFGGGGVGILGSCAEKTSAPDEANPAGACLSMQTQPQCPAL